MEAVITVTLLLKKMYKSSFSEFSDTKITILSVLLFEKNIGFYRTNTKCGFCIWILNLLGLFIFLLSVLHHDLSCLYTLINISTNVLTVLLCVCHRCSPC